MTKTPSDRKDREATRPGPELLTPLPTTESPEPAAPADIRLLVEMMGEFKAFVEALPLSPDSGIEGLRQATENLATAIQALRTDFGQREERQAAVISELRETRTDFRQGMGDLAAKLEAAASPGDSLEAQARAFQDMREAVERLDRLAGAMAGEAAREQRRPEHEETPHPGLEALDAWRDDFIREVNSLLAREVNEVGVPATDAGALQAETLARVDRITARLSLVESEVTKATATMAEALGTVTTALTEHGESMRRAEASNLQTRREVGFLHDAVDIQAREHRLWRRAWVAPLLSLLAIIAAMVLEGYTHWINRLLIFLLPSR